MIIWGSKGREIVERTGSFFCPECGKEEDYDVKRIGKYFTLYFVPLFQTNVIARFVECQSCKTQYKEEILSLKERSRSQLVSQEEKEFKSVSDLVKLHMAITTMLYRDWFQKMTPKEEKQYLAFELGVIEHFDRTVLRVGEHTSDDRVFNFITFYAKHTYGDSSENVLQFWRSLAMHGLMHRERKYGFDSVNDERRPDGSRREGHFPGGYLKDAIGIEI